MYPGRRFFPAPQPQQQFRGNLGNVPAAPLPPVEEEMLVPLTVSLTASQTARDVGKDIDKDGDFVLTHVWGKADAVYSILLRFYTGRALMSAPVRSDNFVGTVQFKTALKPMLYPAGSRISVDLYELQAATNDIELVFGGIRQIRQR